MANTPLIITAATEVEGLELVIDGWPDRTHKLRTKIGSEPLEYGRAITDYARPEPERIALSGVVSDMGGADRPAAAYKVLQAMNRESRVVRVVTEWAVYPEMVMERADVPTDGRGARISIEFRELVRAARPTGRSRQLLSSEALTVAQRDALGFQALFEGGAATFGGTTRESTVVRGTTQTVEVEELPPIDPAQGSTDARVEAARLRERDRLAEAARRRRGLGG